MCWKTLQEGSIENLCTPGVYVDTKIGMSNIPMVKRIARMFFSGYMNNRFISKRVGIENEL